MHGMQATAAAGHIQLAGSVRMRLDFMTCMEMCLSGVRICGKLLMDEVLRQTQKVHLLIGLAGYGHYRTMLIVAEVSTTVVTTVEHVSVAQHLAIMSRQSTFITAWDSAL